MTLGSFNYPHTKTWNESFEKNLHWKNIGEIHGVDKIREEENYE